jgi:hypothetical protein
LGWGKVVIWHVIVDGEQRGPLSHDQVCEYLHDGQLVGSDLIWRPGFSDWKLVSDVAELWQPPKRGSLPPPVPAPTDISRNVDNNEAVATPLIAIPKKWSIWKAANAGLLVSLLPLVLQIASGRGFEIASLVQTASIATIAQLAGQILGMSLLFVIIASVVNVFKWQLPKSDARAIEGAIVFSLLLVGIGVSLALYEKWFFSSTERISGATRDYVMSTMQPVCVQRQISLRKGEIPSDRQISEYCQCVSIKMADITTYKGLTRDSNAPDVQEYLKKQAEAAGQTCRAWMGL